LVADPSASVASGRAPRASAVEPAVVVPAIGPNFMRMPRSTRTRGENG